MWTVLSPLLLATVAMAYQGPYNDHYEGEPVVSDDKTFFYARFTTALTCRPRAVCGVVFDFNRTEYDANYNPIGLTPERRITQHCSCPSNGECPFDAEHRVFASVHKREYLCRPISRMRPCNRNDREGRNPKAAMELVDGDEEFGFHNYERINCLCPRHAAPVGRHRFRDGLGPRGRPRRRFGQRPRMMELATELTRVRHDIGRHMEFHERACIFDD